MTALDRLVTRRDRSYYRLVKRLQEAGLLARHFTTTEANGIPLRRHPRDKQSFLDFTSSNYLGLSGHSAVRRAGCRALQQCGVSLSRPRLWTSDLIMRRLEDCIARMVGQQRALVFPSTTHIVHDVLPLLAGKHGAIFIDEHAYPISLSGAQATGRNSVPVYRFRHNDAAHLQSCLIYHGKRNDNVIVCDGLYMNSGQICDLSAFDQLACDFNAVIYVDDAQGVGLLGAKPTQQMPYGFSGAGTLQHHSVPLGRVVHVATLAKGIGVPVAFVAGPDAFIDYLSRTAFSFTHNSLPALPVLAAALRALQLHAAHGDSLRRILLQRVRFFNCGMKAIPGIHLSQHLFPMQSLYFSSPRETEWVASRLRDNGILVVVQFLPADNPTGGALRFLLTVGHSFEDIERLMYVLSAFAKELRSRPV